MKKFSYGIALALAVLTSCEKDNPAPDAPATTVVNLKITTTTAGNELTWNAIADATSYNIYTRVDNKTLKIGTSTANSYTDTFPYAGLNNYSIVAVVNNVEIYLQDRAQTTVPNQLFTVPDERFISLIKNKFPYEFTTVFTTDNKLIINSHVVRLYNGGFGLTRSAIKTIEGIEFFTALTILNCGGNQLTTLDLSKNTALTYLDCSNNQLTTLDVSKNTALTRLECYNNQLTTLDLSKNTALTDLYCGSNLLTTLDVSKNTALTSLNCSSNQLTTLDVSSQKSWGYTLSLSINDYLVTLKVNASQKQHDEIKGAKTKRGAAITISTYTNSSAEVPVCGNYDPNTDTCL